MSRPMRTAWLTFAAAVLLAGAALAQSSGAGSIKVEGPWMRSPPPAAKVAGGFLTITNTGTVADRLIGATAAVAGHVEIHEMSMTEGVMRMRELKPGLEIAAGATVVLKPGSFHVMMMDLKSPVAAGAMVKGTLVFEKAGTVDVEYKVEAAGAKAAGHGSGTQGKGSGAGSGAGTKAN